MSDSVQEFVAKTLDIDWDTTAAGTELALSGLYASPKREICAILSATFDGPGTDTGSLDIKMQESQTTVDTDYTDITGAAFTTLTDASTTGDAEQIFFNVASTSKYIRPYATITTGVAAVWAGALLALFLARDSQGK
jgi:hypothetical protein